jgi:hypothetical protein
VPNGGERDRICPIGDLERSLGSLPVFAGGSATYLSQPPVPVTFKTDAPLVGFPTTHRLTNGFTYLARRRLGVPRLYGGELHRRYSAGEALAVWFSSWGHLLKHGALGH